MHLNSIVYLKVEVSVCLSISMEGVNVCSTQKSKKAVLLSTYVQPIANIFPKT